MTYRQFLEALRQTPRDWEIFPGPRIRRDGNQCPVSALRQADETIAMGVGLNLGMRTCVVHRIMNAADGYGANKTRRDLLEACGLKEKHDGGN